MEGEFVGVCVWLKDESIRLSDRVQFEMNGARWSGKVIAGKALIWDEEDERDLTKFKLEVILDDLQEVKPVANSEQ